MSRRLSILVFLATTALRCGPVTTSSPDAIALLDTSRDESTDATRDVLPMDDAPADADEHDAGSQGTLSVWLVRVPDNTPSGAPLHLAGSFNGWSPAADRFSRDDSLPATVLRVRGLSAGQRVEFKVTRGSWATVERDAQGRDRPNRAVTFDPARPSVALFVERWADLGPPSHTRSGDVRVLPAVPIPQLARTRDVWLYLPPGYESSAARYPVLYMFDGQNVFDARASAFGSEWRVDEALEAMFYEGRSSGVIVVALANSDARPCEYNVFASDPHPGCADRSALGDQTNAFIADTLKPRIDQDFRTRSGREDTAVMGSSMGGSMSVRLAFSRPTLFSRVAALSPSYQNTLAALPSMPDYLRAQRPAAPFRLYQDMGSVERIRDLSTDLLVRNMRAVREAAREAGIPDDRNRAEIIADAAHNEDAWSARVGGVLDWLWR